MSDSDSEFEGEQQELDLSNVSSEHVLPMRSRLECRCCLLSNFGSAYHPRGSCRCIHSVLHPTSWSRYLLTEALMLCPQSDVVTKYKAAADIANSTWHTLQTERRHDHLHIV